MQSIINVCACTRAKLLLLAVCRDMEFRVINSRSGDEGTVKSVEVCINDQWHEAAAKLMNNSRSPSPQRISVHENFTSMIITWSPAEQSIPNDKNISGYSVLCTTSSLFDHGQIHEVRVSNISTSTTMVLVSGLLSGTAYQCCVNAHIQTNTPLDLISSNCVSAKTVIVTSTDTGLGIGLGVACLLLIGSIVINIIFLTMHLLKNNAIKFIFKTSCTNE